MELWWHPVVLVVLLVLVWLICGQAFYCALHNGHRLYLFCCSPQPTRRVLPLHMAPDSPSTSTSSIRSIDSTQMMLGGGGAGGAGGGGGN